MTDDMTVVSDEEAPEPDCTTATELAGLNELPEGFVEGAAFFARGGGWCGAEAPIRRCIEIAKRHGLTVTSLKRSWGNAGSDHHNSQTCSFAADMSNSNRESPEMAACFAEIAELMGHGGARRGNLKATNLGVRLQLIYGSEHEHADHNHVGARIVGDHHRPTLRIGDRGPSVSDLQRLLRRHGHAVAIDGIFGQQTRTAVIGFQNSRGLAADGVVGPKTWAALDG